MSHLFLFPSHKVLLSATKEAALPDVSIRLERRSSLIHLGALKGGHVRKVKGRRVKRQTGCLRSIILLRNHRLRPIRGTRRWFHSRRYARLLYGLSVTRKSRSRRGQMTGKWLKMTPSSVESSTKRPADIGLIKNGCFWTIKSK